MKGCVYKKKRQIYPEPPCVECAGRSCYRTRYTVATLIETIGFFLFFYPAYFTVRCAPYTTRVRDSRTIIPLYTHTYIYKHTCVIRPRLRAHSSLPVVIKHTHTHVSSAVAFEKAQHQYPTSLYSPEAPLESVRSAEFSSASGRLARPCYIARLLPSPVYAHN